MKIKFDWQQKQNISKYLKMLLQPPVIEAFIDKKKGGYKYTVYVDNYLIHAVSGFSSQDKAKQAAEKVIQQDLEKAYSIMLGGS